MSEDVQVLLGRFDEKLDALGNRVHELERDRSVNVEMQKSIAAITANLSTLTSKIDALNAKVDELERKPAKRWDSLITAVIGVIVGLAISGILGS